MVTSTLHSTGAALWAEALSLPPSAAYDRYDPSPQSFVIDVLWPEFRELNQALRSYLNEVTLRIIHEEIYADASDAQEVPGDLALK